MHNENVVLKFCWEREKFVGNQMNVNFLETLILTVWQNLPENWPSWNIPTEKLSCKILTKNNRVRSG